jgi:epoxyqueuosine reductase QueG
MQQTDDSHASRIASTARNHGADLVGFSSASDLRDGPPSADPRYMLATARSVVSFAAALDTDALMKFITKTEWRPHCEDRKSVSRRLYGIGEAVADDLRAAGFDAVNVDLNNNYRPEEGASDVTEMVDFHPEFSHRYAALASGLGRLGWSGNLMTREFGSLVDLGSVITSASLPSTQPIADEEHPCDQCKACTAVCPVGMIETTSDVSVTVAGVTESIAAKKPNTCCWIGCTGYEGLSRSGTWSNWSPYRLGHPLPESTDEMNRLCTTLQKQDPQMRADDNPFEDFRKAVFDPQWFYYTVCGFCRSVCWPHRGDRLANRKRIHSSGTAGLRFDGEHVVADDSAVEIPTPFGVRVVVPGSELTGPTTPEARWPGQFPLDREVIRHVRRGLHDTVD